ncbi:MAG: FG-GAP repeat protein [Myxococcales bacterium]|nr:MAG: FG-GAP repeat protein [Myxococcales bacterium]
MNFRQTSLLCILVFGLACGRIGFDSLTNADTVDSNGNCTDGILNGNESAIDCGGACAACPQDQTCNNGSDCVSGVCANNQCAAVAHCLDAVLNNDESDIDCGGTDCLPCGDGQNCLNTSDCESMVCAVGVCQVPSCSDGVQNGNEGGVDCGGSACDFCSGSTVLTPTWSQSSRDYFGWDIDTDGNYSIIGSPEDDEQGSAAGAVYLAERSGQSWSIVERITASDPNAGYEFGISVAIHGNYALAGVYFDHTIENDSGAFYVLERASDGSWSECAKVKAAIPVVWEKMGWSGLVYDGRYAFVPAPFYGDSESAQGQVHVFERSSGCNFVELQGAGFPIQNPSPTPDANFGIGVELDGSYLAISAPGDSNAGSNVGAVYLFTLQGSEWFFSQSIVPQTPVSGGSFGDAISLVGTQLLIGASGSNSTNGNAYISELVNGSWSSPQLTLSASQTVGEYYGAGVGIAGQTLLVGAPQGNNIYSNFAGRIASFSKDQNGDWSEGPEIAANINGSEDAFFGGFFGSPIVTKNGWTLVSSMLDPNGRVYFYPY